MNVYLAGPLSKSPDSGKKFRTEAELFLKTVGVTSINPLSIIEEGILIEQQVDAKQFHTLKHDPQRRHEFCRIMREIIFNDLQMIKNCDLVLACWNLPYMGSGTASELTYAYIHSIPSVIYLDEGVEDINTIDSWAYGCADLTYPSFDMVKEKWPKIVRLVETYKKATLKGEL